MAPGPYAKRGCGKKTAWRYVSSAHYSDKNRQNSEKDTWFSVLCPWRPGSRTGGEGNRSRCPRNAGRRRASTVRKAHPETATNEKMVVCDSRAGGRCRAYGGCRRRGAAARRNEGQEAVLADPGGDPPGGGGRPRQPVAVDALPARRGRQLPQRREAPAPGPAAAPGRPQGPRLAEPSLPGQQAHADVRRGAMAHPAVPGAEGHGGRRRPGVLRRHDPPARAGGGQVAAAAPFRQGALVGLANAAGARRRGLGLGDLRQALPPRAGRMVLAQGQVAPSHGGGRPSHRPRGHDGSAGRRAVSGQHR